MTRHEQRKRRSSVFWMGLKTDQVFDAFSEIKNAQIVGKKDNKFLYVPGTRDDRVLLVSHADTVWDDAKIKIHYNNGLLSSGRKGTGIGADDRAGCAILWRLRESGHSLLIPNAEESGCVGSRFLMSKPAWEEEIGKHQFAIEFDRANASDLVFYGVGSPEFKNWAEANIPGYKFAHGSYTDIVHLCKKICGLNISVGYYGQHTSNERLNINEWERTVRTITATLNQKGLPRFERKMEEWHPRQSYLGGYCGEFDEYEHAYRQSRGTREEQIERHLATVASTTAVLPKSNKTYLEDLEDLYGEKKSVKITTLITCPHCALIQDYCEIDGNQGACVACNKKT